MGSSGAAKFDIIGEEYAFWNEKEFIRRLYDTLLEFMPEPCKVVLDAGCGTALLTLELAPRATLAVGLELSWTMILLTRKRVAARGVRNVRLVLGDIERPPLRAGTTDFIVSVFVLHYTDLTVSLPALRALLSPRGRLAVRCLVAKHPHWEATLPAKVLFALLAAPGLVLRHGVSAAWRIVRLLLSRAWRSGFGKLKPTPAQLERAFALWMPGCTFESPQRGSMGVYFAADAPSKATVRAATARNGGRSSPAPKRRRVRSRR